MAKSEREKIGPFVVTTRENLPNGEIVCAMCGRVLARLLPEGRHEPGPADLLAAERVPVPNFGWFCDQKCARDYEAAYAVVFHRDANGDIDYYEASRK